MRDEPTQSGSWFERYAWVLLLLVSLPFLIFGISALMFGLSLSDFPVGIPGGPEAVKGLTGTTWNQVFSGNPEAVTLLRGISRVAGLALLGFAVFVIMASSIPFRKGQRWAWFALLVVPGFMTGLLFHELKGGFVQMPAIFLVLSLLGLILPYRMFFRRA
ncbi:MAG: hypothetical protein ACT4PO_05695 [Actinomycetota bacterium]